MVVQWQPVLGSTSSTWPRSRATAINTQGQGQGSSERQGGSSAPSRDFAPPPFLVGQIFCPHLQAAEICQTSRVTLGGSLWSADGCSGLKIVYRGSRGSQRVTRKFCISILTRFVILAGFLVNIRKSSPQAGRILTAPPPLGVKMRFFTSGTRAGDMRCHPPYFKGAERSLGTL